MQPDEQEVCLRVCGVAKTYRVFHSPAQRLKDLLGLKAQHQDISALQPLSFTVKRGETVAIVGANGSGKSTLLQLICGTLTPSQGHVERHGRIAALLELGAGFNPDFSGLDNVYLNASINGLSRSWVDGVLDDILRFADIGDYINQPVKTYSSGMYVRLAFAVAIHMEPELLIIDEALAVGDEAFQRKCFARLRELQAKGVSLLFVSHSADSVVSLCDRALLLDSGHLLFDGVPRQAVALYQKLLYAKPEQRAKVRAEILTADHIEHEEAPVTESCQTPNERVFVPHAFDYVEGMQAECTDFFSNGATIDEVMFRDELNQLVNVLHKGRRYRYCYRVRFEQAASNVYFANLIKRVNGASIGGMCTTSPKQPEGISVHAGDEFEVSFALDVQLNAGTYFINAGVHGETAEHHGFLARKLDAFMFKVVSAHDHCATGSVDLGMEANIERIFTTPVLE